jgi:hypothetical protein
MTPAEIALAKGASDVWEFTYDRADVAQTFVFDSNDWGLHIGDGVDISDAVRPGLAADGETSTPGTWIASVTLFHLETFASAHVTWEGSGLTVEYSLDNETWTAISQKGVVALDGDADFDIRVTFAGGVVDDPAALTRLTVYVMKTDTVYSTGSRHGTFTADAMTDEGLILRDGGLLIPASTLDPAPTVGTIELWARVDQAYDDGWVSFLEYLNWTAGGWIGFYNDGSSTVNHWQADNVTAVYVDGVEVASNSSEFTLSPPLGWHHWVMVSDAAINNDLGIAMSPTDGQGRGDVAISHVALYPQRMTATEASNLYKAQDPVPVRVDDAATVTVTEHSTDIYAYNWSLVSG